MSWETTVSTGNPEYDRQMVEQYRAQAAQAGMDLQVQPMPSGGYHVRGVPRGAAPAAAAHAAYAGVPSQAAGPAAAAQPMTSERLAYLRKVYGYLGSAMLLAIVAGYALLEFMPTETFKIQ